MTYSTPKLICKGRTLDRPIAFGFDLVQSGFGVWDVRNKSKKEEDGWFGMRGTKSRIKIEDKLARRQTIIAGST